MQANPARDRCLTPGEYALWQNAQRAYRDWEVRSLVDMRRRDRAEDYSLQKLVEEDPELGLLAEEE